MMPDKKHSDLQDREEELAIEFRLNEETSAGAKIIRINESPKRGNSRNYQTALATTELPRIQVRKQRSTARLEAAKKVLEEAGCLVEQPGEHHIKVGIWNFYPGTGTITMDGRDTVWKHKTVADFLDILKPKKKRR